MTLPEIIAQNEVDIVHAENAVRRLREPASGETYGDVVNRWVSMADAKAELRTRRELSMMLAQVKL